LEVKLATLLLACAAAACTSARHDTSPDAPSGGATRALAVAAPASATGVMRVHCIDVGQGSATLFEFPSGAVLVDAGGESNASFNFEDELRLYLAEFFARRLDLNGELTSLILTHPHLDHTGGVELVLDHWPPRNVVTNGQTYGSGSKGQRLAHAYALQHEPDGVGFRAVRVKQIPAAGLSDAVVDPIGPAGPGLPDPTLTILWGELQTDPGDWGQSFGKPRFANNNNHSIVLRVDYGDASVLVTGDLEDVAIEDMLARYAGSGVLDVDVYVAGHHGSANGTTDELLAAASPEYGLVSMGVASRESDWTAWAYGHPRAEVIDALQRSIPTLRPAIDARVGQKSKTFVDQRITQAVYATGWDGTVVLEAGADGAFTVVRPRTELVNINIASATELERLPGIGPAKAAAIVAYRLAHGAFASIEQLDDVAGIGAATVQAVRALATVGGAR
jgi:competence protein ComEC